MFISVIIPTRNRFDYVTLLVDDLLEQNMSDYEIIVVDQSDNPKVIKNCNHIITKSLGPCVSRNTGASQAKGEILVFLDDDARINEDFLKEITSPIINDRFDVVAGAMCDPDGNYLLEDNDFLTQKNSNFIKVITSNPDSNRSRITLAFPGCCAAILTSVFHDVGGFNEQLDPTGAGEDRDMALKLYKKGYAIWYNAKAKLLHAVAPYGGTRDTGSRSLMLDVHSYRMCQTYFSEELSQALKQTIIRQYRRNFYNSLKTFTLVRSKYRVLQEVKRLLK